MAIIAPWFDQRWYAADGVTPLAGGKIFTYAAGTTTKKATYTTYAGNVANTNPIILSSTGTASIFLGDGLYKFVVCPAIDTDPPISPIRTMDNIGFQSLQTVSTYTALRALSAGGVGDCVHVLGAAAAGDGGEGFFYAATSSASDDGGIVIAPGSGGSTRWFRAFSGDVNIRWYGCKGDGSTNDTTAFSNASSYAYNNNYSLFAPKGTYMILNATLYSDLRGESKDETIFKSIVTADDYNLFNAVGSIHIRNVTIDGQQGSQSKWERDTINFNGTDIEVSGCLFINTMRSGIEITAGNANIHDNVFKNMAIYNGTAGMLSCAVYAVGATNSRIKFNNNDVYQSSDAGTHAYNPGGIIISGSGCVLQASGNSFKYIGQDADSKIGAISVSTSGSASMIGNIIDNGEIGIYLYGCADNVIGDNKIISCKYGVIANNSSFTSSSNAFSGTSIYNYKFESPSSSGVTISGDKCSGAVTSIYGTSLSNLHLTISGCVVNSGTDSRSILLSSASTVIVQGCYSPTGKFSVTETTFVSFIGNKCPNSPYIYLSGNYAETISGNSWQIGSNLSMYQNGDLFYFGKTGELPYGWTISVIDTELVFDDENTKLIVANSGHLILSVVANLQTLFTTSESATAIVLGWDAYKKGLAVITSLTKNSKSTNGLLTGVIYQPGDLNVYGVLSSSDLTLKKVTGTIRVRITYAKNTSLPDAA